MTKLDYTSNWFLEKDHKELAKKLSAQTEHLVQSSNTRTIALLEYYRLYTGDRTASFDRTDLFREAAAATIHNGRKNIVKSVVDSVAAKLVGTGVPRIEVLPDNADAKLAKRAEKLTVFFDGVFHQNRIYERGVLFATKAEVFGTSVWLPVVDEDGNIRVDDIPIYDLYVDEAEAYYGTPPNYYLYRSISRSALLSLFPEHEEAILELPSSKKRNKFAKSDEIDCWQCWHLSSSKKAKNGRYVFIANDLVLDDCKYLFTDHPFVINRYSDPLIGFYGSGIVKEIASVQVEVDQMTETVSESLKFAVPRLYVASDSGINPDDISDEPNTVVVYNAGSTPPQIMANSALLPEFYNRLERLEQAAYELVGASQLSAQSQKPASLTSGRALLEYRDIESNRFAIQAKKFENCFVELAKKIIQAVQHSGVSPKVKGLQNGKRFVATIEWNEIDYNEDAFYIRCYAASSLSKDPSGRRQEVIEMMNAGLITDQKLALSLAQLPDTDAYKTLELSNHDLTEQIIYSILYEDEPNYIAPDKYMLLPESINIAQKHMMLARLQNVDPERRELLQNWIDQAADIIAEEQAKAAPPPSPEQAAPPPPPPDASMPPQ